MNYLIVSEQRSECEGCGAVIRPGIVSLAGGSVRCPECLKAPDARLAAAWAMIHAYGSLAALDQHTRPEE